MRLLPDALSRFRVAVLESVLLTVVIRLPSSQIKSLTEAGRKVDAGLAHPIDHAFSGVRYRLVFFR
jgi:hypothetical protein